MKAEIINGILEIYPHNDTEEYALEKWYGENVDQCTGETNGKNMSFCPVKHPHNKFWFRFWFRLKLRFSRLKL